MSAPGRRTSTRQRRPSSRQLQNQLLDDESALYKSMRKNTLQRMRGKPIPECPVFQPTAEQWTADPIAYIHSLSDAGHEAGIIKIVLPPECRPSSVQLPDDVRFETKRQVLHAMQEGEPFDDGKNYTQAEYAAYAQHVHDQWLRDHPQHARRLAEAREQGSDAAVDVALEDTYWSLVEQTSDDVHVVEYASDIDTGSLYEHIPPLVRDLSTGRGSLLTKLGRPVGGLTVPWLYFGSFFSTFCWHTEDHFLYSCNVHHHGAPKTWYGVPMDGARRFEEALRLHMPHLFRKDRDLLHQLTVTLAPHILMHAGVPVVRTVQRQHEVVVTFPRAYHCGFSHGFNCAEAANLAVWDWLPVGQAAINVYSMGPNMRPAVFSHERVLWAWVQTALQPITLRLHCPQLPLHPPGYQGALPGGPSMATCDPATLALLQRLTKRAGLSAATLAALRRAAAAEAAEGAGKGGNRQQHQLQKRKRSSDEVAASDTAAAWLVEWVERVGLHDTERLDQGFVAHMRQLAAGARVALSYDAACVASHCASLGLDVDNLRHVHDAVLQLGVRELHARWMLRLEGCREAQADVDGLMAEEITCDLCSALPFFSYIRCTCGSKKVACCHTERCWAYCGCELSTRELRLSVPDHDLLAAMAALWMALPPQTRTEALEELVPRAPRPRGKRRGEEEGGHTEPSSCTRDSEWELDEEEVDDLEVAVAGGEKRSRV